jgi:signal transduction histidine kinase
MGSGEPAARELQQLREEHALLAELLQVDRIGLRNFMAFAARSLTRARTLLLQRTREHAAYQRKLSRLQGLYRQLQQRAAALALPSLARQLEDTIAALAAPRSAGAPSGDALLPALACSDAVFMTLSSIAEHTGVPLLARRTTRRRGGRNPGAGAAGTRVCLPHAQAPQLALALQQLSAQLAGTFGKLVELTTIGLERVPEMHTGSFYDMLSQMLRNAIEHGIETPAQRRAAGKNVKGGLLVEFQPRQGGQSELIFQDDGQGLNTDRIIQAAVAGGLLADDALFEQDPRRASTLIFHAGLSTAADPSGRGFGMRILRDNVKRLHGQIQVATKRGQFTRLRIRMPMALPGVARAARAQA